MRPVGWCFANVSPSSETLKMAIGERDIRGKSHILLFDGLENALMLASYWL